MKKLMVSTESVLKEQKERIPEKMGGSRNIGKP